MANKKSEVEVENFKGLILDMHKGYPKWSYDAEYVEREIPKFQIKILRKEGYLIYLEDTENKEKKYYMLGHSALSLVSSWKTENMTKSVRTLTWVLVVLTFVLIILTIIIYFGLPIKV